MLLALLFSPNLKPLNPTTHPLPSSTLSSPLRMQYVKDRQWHSVEIAQCSAIIATTNAKISLSESLTVSALDSQRFLLEALSTKWKTGYTELSGRLIIA